MAKIHATCMDTCTKKTHDYSYTIANPITVKYLIMHTNGRQFQSITTGLHGGILELP